jgi:hypothetical protein
VGNGDDDQDNEEPQPLLRCTVRDAKHACAPLRRVRAGEVRREEFLYTLKAAPAGGRLRRPSSRRLDHSDEAVSSPGRLRTLPKCNKPRLEGGVAPFAQVNAVSRPRAPLAYAYPNGFVKFIRSKVDATIVPICSGCLLPAKWSGR